MCEKSVEPTSDAGVSTSPLRNPATPTKNASPRKLPVPRPSPTKNLCEACLNEVTVFTSLSTFDNDISSFDNLSLNIKTPIIIIKYLSVLFTISISLNSLEQDIIHTLSAFYSEERSGE